MSVMCYCDLMHSNDLIVSSACLSSTGTHKFVKEGEEVGLTAITKEQSGSYDCIASNDISSPDIRTVQVTVNCKGQTNHILCANR